MSVEILGLKETLANLSPSKITAPKHRFLTRSITYRVERDRAIVGTNVKYAPFQEFGTRYITPNRFLRGGLDASQGAIRREISRFEKELGASMGGE
jgi:phage gpG-like protein